MSVRQLKAELVASGWDLRERAVWLAARFYLGIDSLEEIKRELTESEVSVILRMR